MRFRWFKTKPRKDASIFDMRNQKWWGDSVVWNDIERHRVHGWCYQRPQKGDVLKSMMASGRVGVFVFTKVELCRDPDDMFFGTVEQIGYETSTVKEGDELRGTRAGSPGGAAQTA